MRSALAALMLCAMTAPAVADDFARLPPPAAPDAAAATLDAQVRRIVAARDLEALAKLAVPEVRLSFGEEAGRETLRDWAAQDWFWPEWDRIAAHPPALAGDGADAYLAYPWYFLGWPEAYDPFDYLIGLEGAALRDRPAPEAAAIADLSYAILPGDVEDSAPEGWRRICFDAGPCGFVEDQAVASPMGWRAVFQRLDGVWRMTAFVAGD